MIARPPRCNFSLASSLPYPIPEFRFPSGVGHSVSSVLNGVEPALKLILPWESIISFSWNESVMNY